MIFSNLCNQTDELVKNKRGLIDDGNVTGRFLLSYII